MMFSFSSALITVMALASTLMPVQAGHVCPDGQMAVGTEFLQMFTFPASSFNVYSGFLMANNCGLISQSGNTQNSNEMCKGKYSDGARVECDDNHNPIGAVDTVGAHWTCSSAGVGIGCNVGGSGGAFRVQACCTRD